MSQDEQPVNLRVALSEIAVEERWSTELAERFADVAIRRWRSFQRRVKPNKRTAQMRVQDLIQGLRQASPIDPIYMEPGAFERLAARFGEVLSSSPTAG